MWTKKTVRNALLFMTVLAFLLAGTSFLVAPKDYVAYDILAVERKTRAMESEPENSIDVLFLGDSESCDVYSPVQLYGEQGFTSYNTGSRAQRISDTYAILQQELKRQSPKLVVVEVNNVFKQETLYNNGDNAEIFTEKILPIAHYHSFYKLFQIPEIIYGMNTEYAKASVLKGFWYRKQSVAYTGRKDYMNASTKEVNIPEGSGEYLEKIVDLAKSKEIQVLLISSPSPKNWTEGKSLAIADWAKEKGETFLDLNEQVDEMGIDWNTDSLDRGDHVNFSGTLKINSYIGKILKEEYDLPDHSADQTYQAWSNLYTSSNLYNKQ